MENIRILWADDEIDLLKIHIMFLEEKGHSVVTVNNGDAAIDQVINNKFDLILLDENMPGMSGLETLSQIKTFAPTIPVVMITKSEEEDIMDEAIGSKISDYLIKPVNPNQILLAIKKHVQNRELITRKTTSAYQTDFTKLGMLINDTRTFADWVEVYKKLVYWELELSRSNDNTMDEVLKMQKSEANNNFTRYVKKNYIKWFEDFDSDRPLLSPDLFRRKVIPQLKDNKVFVLVIDNLRFDQWKVMEPLIRQYYDIEEEDVYCSILPTATQYARNAIFAGLMPYEIKKLMPDLWTDDEEEGSKNMYEKELLQKQFNRLGVKYKFAYEKIMNNKTGKKLVDTLSQYTGNELNVFVYNFIDMLSHARTDMDMIRELAADEPAYRSLTYSWFEHSPLLELFKELSERKIKVVITTDHGTIRVQNPIKVIGDRNTTTNLRYKQGKNLNYNQKEVFEITNPLKAHLPASNISSTFIFAQNDDFFAYPNNFNHYVKYYKDTFQHGGISLEEMMIPVITLAPKS